MDIQLDYDYYFQHTSEFPFPEVFENIKYPWDAFRNADTLIKRLVVDADAHEMNGKLLGNSHFHNNYIIGEGTVIYNDVTIIGPVIIGKNCEIMPGSVIRPGTVMGDNCVAGHGSEIKHCIVQNGAKIQSQSFAGDCVIGKSARIGSGVITANRNFDQSVVAIKTPNGRVSTGTAFFGCILGDNSRLGANSVTQPGTMIGPYSWIYPTTPVRGFIPAKKRVFVEKPLAFTDNEAHDLT